MPKNIPLVAIETDDVPLIALGTDYAHGTLLDWHEHSRAQLLYSVSGSMKVDTKSQTWVVPVQRGVWIPAGEIHRVLMLGASTRSLYIEPELTVRPGRSCEVLHVGALLRQLLLEAVHMPLRYKEGGRDAALVSLLLHELAEAPSIDLQLPMPDQGPLSLLCEDFLRAPSIHSAPEEWAARLNVSRRTFSRKFHTQTGLSFQQWRQRACVTMSLSQLAEGKSVTSIALEMGYESPATFSTMFRRILGKPPSAFAAHPGDLRTEGRIVIR
ncbi:helix-turn-helix domain-containing protein [Telmatospirillum sp. J64-1]|uniref:AraC family transcriptional regulator n=1 Tax=Telmatospirillum sp. J64-1 TaxID=2502183 RepID=UPI0021083371|nr:helix-turn-helix transcriptional regulator [Telmatospirillum sp. J64-1]